MNPVSAPVARLLESILRGAHAAREVGGLPDGVYDEVVDAFVKIDFDSAVKLVAECEGSFVSHELAVTMAEEDPQRLMDLVRSMPQSVRFGLYDLAERLAETHPEQSKLLFAEALDGVRHLSFDLEDQADIVTMFLDMIAWSCHPLFTDGIVGQPKGSAWRRVLRGLVEGEPRHLDRLRVSATRLIDSLPAGKHKNALAVTVACSLAWTDPDEAERVLASTSDDDAVVPDWVSGPVPADASVRERSWKVLALAERRALAGIENSGEESGLGAVICAWAAIDLVRAESLLARLPKDDLRAHAHAIRSFTELLAVRDIDRAAGLTGQLASDYAGISAVADGLWPIDPARAEAVIGEIPRDPDPDTDLVFYATVLEFADIDVDLAERIALSMPDEWWKLTAIYHVADVMAAVKPYRAERLAREAPGSADHRSVAVLVKVAGSLAGTDPDRACRLLRETEDITRHLPEETVYDKASKATAFAQVARTLARVAPERAVRLLEQAERLLSEIDWPEGSSTREQAWAWQAIAQGWATIDAARAERSAGRIPEADDGWALRLEALASIALDLHDPPARFEPSDPAASFEDIEPLGASKREPVAEPVMEPAAKPVAAGLAVDPVESKAWQYGKSALKAIGELVLLFLVLVVIGVLIALL